MLATGAARPVRVDPEIFLVDLDLDILRQLRPHKHGCERRVAPGRLIKRRDTHEAMHTSFGRHQPIRIVAGQHECGALDARFVAWLIIDDLALETAALRPLQVHAQQHLRPILRFGAARARMDCDDGVGAIVLAAEHLLRLGRLDLRLELAEAAREIRADVLPSIRPLDQHAQIVDVPAERLPQRHVFLQTPAALHYLLRVGLVTPEIGLARLLLDVGELFVKPGTLKDASAVPLPGARGLRTGGLSLRVRLPQSSLLWAGRKARPHNAV